MIRTVAELLESFRKKEAEILNKKKIDHAPTIGSMYEGLTKEMLSSTIPLELNLKVVSGFITNSDGALSDQIDCMLVQGEGEKIPYTDDFKYHIDDVVAVIEVKKNLYSKEIASAYDNLMSVKQLQKPKRVNRRMSEDAYRAIVRNHPPSYDELSELPLYKQMIFHSLVVEEWVPIRIILGYRGFRSEFSFREAFVKYLKTKEHTKGFTPTGNPSLIICGVYSLIKLNGMPYHSPMKDTYWDIYGSSSDNPMIFLLELIWTRLSYHHGLSTSIFGDDLEMEIIKPLLAAKAVKGDKRTQWRTIYFNFSKEEIEQELEPDQWKPAVLDEAQHIIVNILCMQECIDIRDEAFISFISARGLEVESFIAGLVDTDLVSVENNKMSLLTLLCRVATLPDGRYVAGEDSTGRFSSWLNNYIENRKGKKDSQ